MWCQFGHVRVDLSAMAVVFKMSIWKQANTATLLEVALPMVYTLCAQNFVPWERLGPKDSDTFLEAFLR